MTPAPLTKHMGKTVNPALITDYEEFRRHPDPFDLRDDLASLRTLIVEFRQSISDNNLERRVRFAKAAAVDAARALRDSPEVAEWFPELEDRVDFSKMAAKVFYQVLPIAYVEFFGECSRITPEEAKVAAHLVDVAGKITERHRKMMEQKQLQVTFDSQMVMLLMRFMAEVIAVLPVDYRPLVAETARNFFAKARAADHEVVDGA